MIDTPADLENHPVDRFWKRLGECDCYPTDLVPVPEMLPGTAAFAASAGVWRAPRSRQLPAFPFGGVMIVGHNLDNADGYNARRKAPWISHGDDVPGLQRPMKTWSVLYRILNAAGVERGNIFFTNAYVGLKVSDTNTGPVSRAADERYRTWCREFLYLQMTVMRPSVIVPLGVPACNVVSKMLSPRPWPPGNLPPAGTATQADVFGNATTVVPMQHPSFTSNARLAADARSLQQAWSHRSTCQ